MLYKYTEKEDSGQLSSVGSVSNSISSFTSLGSTNGSWDEQEQEYANKATKQVTEMVLELENLLYKDHESKIHDQRLLEECEQWSSLFPHLRLYGTQVIASKDIGYHFIETNETAKVIDITTEEEPILSLNGIKFGIDSVPSKKEEFVQDHQTQSKIDWSDSQVQNQLTKMQKNGGWALFRIEIENVETDRASTPTQENFKTETQIEVTSYYTVKLVREGTAEFGDLKPVPSSSEFILQSLNGYLIHHQWQQPLFRSFSFDNIDAATSNDPDEFQVTEWDLVCQFPHCSIISFHYLSFNEFLNTVKSKLENMDGTLDIQETSHGVVDEYFALDSLGNTDNTAKQETHIKEEVVQTIFDDLWSEVYPKLHPLLLKTLEINSRNIQSIETSHLESNILNLEEDSIDGDDILGAMTIKSIPLHKRDASVRHKANELLPFQHFEPVWEGVQPSPKIQRPASAMSLKRPTSARPIESSSRFGGKSANLKGRGVRLQPINSTINVSFQEVAQPVRQWDTRPSTAHGKRLPPIKPMIPIESDSQIKRHVAFEPLVDTFEAKYLSHRPFSGKFVETAKRAVPQFRTKLASRPQTAMSERVPPPTKKKSFFGVERDLNPVLGIRGNTNRNLMKDTRRTWQ